MKNRLLALATALLLAALPLAAAPMVESGFFDSASAVRPLLVGSSTQSEIELSGVDGKKLAFSKLLGGKPAVLVFYRGGWCPYCNTQLSDLRKLVAPLKEKGYQLVAVSPDQPSELFKSVEKNELDYTLVSDSNAELIKSFGIGFVVDEATRTKYAGYGIDLAKASGQKHSVLPVPSVFVLDAAGKVQFEYVNPDYSVRVSSKLVLTAIEDIAMRKVK